MACHRHYNIYHLFNHDKITNYHVGWREKCGGMQSHHLNDLSVIITDLSELIIYHLWYGEKTQ